MYNINSVVTNAFKVFKYFANTLAFQSV